ncbi:RES family NAD+ phosphorylase [Prosthecobacter vanneervenii]|uniref:RES domain-containing protein n=1 Tax=Prosthecobacter vanneervenii TaxID=48466 RepID=A0A7W7Y8P3_9BACT|nr:RES family NAD+ phosphorylase [Prosthecobacter vanneervenii]MBB5031467.1 RES domain-containing protein [Prosthecobacter vanneervenii]
MKLKAWRIVKEKHAATAFSGEGARLFGGRWNSPGVSLVYTSSTQALAVLESLVHLNPPVLFKYVVIPVEFDSTLVETPPVLPPDWAEQPAPPSTQALGDHWARESRSAILQLPSVIIPAEPNYLLNPTHPDFRKIAIGKPVPFSFDPRLV